MKNLPLSLVVFALSTLAMLSLPSAQAGSQTWGSSTTGNWSDTTKWVGLAAPGSTSILTNPDTATFSNAAGATALTIDSTTQNIGSLLFGAGAGAYTIGTTGGNSLLLSSGGSITNSLTAATNQTVNAPLVLEPVDATSVGTYSINNNNSNNSGALIIGGAISGGTTTQGITLTLGGTNTSSSNALSGIISNGGATGKVALVKNGNGTWKLSGANTYSGGTVINAGRVVIGVGSTFAGGAVTNGAFGTGTVTLADGVTIAGSGALTSGANNWVLNGNVAIGASGLASRISLSGAYDLNGTGASNGSSGTVRTMTLFNPYAASAYTGNTSGTNQLDLGVQTNGPAISVANGTLRFAADAGIGAGSFAGVQLGAISFTGATGLTIGNKVITSISAGTPFTAGGSVDPRMTVESGGFLQSGAGTAARILNVYSLMGAGTVTNLSNNVTPANTVLTIDGADTAEFSGVIANGADFASTFTGISGINGTISVVKSGSGTQTLSGANTYSAGTTLTSGTLSVGASNNLGSSASALTFNGGTLQITGTTLTNFSGIGHTVTFTAAKTVGLDINNASNTFTADQVLNQTSGGLTKAGNGTLILNQNNTYTGATTVSSGTLKLGAAGDGTNGPLGTTGSGTTVNSGGALDINGFTLSTTEALTVNGTGISNAGAFTNSGTAASYSGAVTIGTAGTYIGGAGDITLSAALATNANSFNKVGADTLTLTVNSSRTGGVSVDNGTLRLTSATALGTSAATVTLNGGTLSLANNSGTTFGPYNTTLTSNSTIETDTTSASAGVNQVLGTLAISGQTLSIAKGNNATGSTAGVAFGATTFTTANATFSIGANTTLTLGAVTNSTFTPTVTGAGNFAQSGVWGNGSGGISFDSGFAGVATLNQSNTFTGGVSLASGTLNINSAGTAGTNGPLGNGGTFVIAGGTLDNTSGSSKTIANVNPLTINGNFAFTGGSGTTHDLNLGTGATTLGTAAGTSRTITANAGTLTLGGVIADGTTANSLVKEGAGTLTLSGANTFTGGVTVNTGTIQAIGSAVGNGTTAVVTGAFGTGNLTLSNGITLNGQSGTRTVIAAPQINIAGNLTLVTNTGNIELDGVIDLGSASRTVTLGKQSAGYSSGQEVFRLGGTIGVNGFTSPSVQSGTLILTTTTGTAALPSVARIGNITNFVANAGLTLDDGVALTSGNGNFFGTGTNAPVLTLNAAVTKGGGVIQMGDGINGGNATMRNAEVYSLSGGGTVSSSNTTGTLTTGTLTINNGNGATFSGTITETGGTGRIAVSKTGSGSQTFSGNNSYTGATNVTAGTLIINGDQTAANGVFTVSANAKLGGGGTIGGATTINGILAPGNSVGTLNIASTTTWNYNNAWQFELGAAGGTMATFGSSDLLNITGSFTKGTGSTFTFDFLGGGANGWYKLVDWSVGTTFVGTEFATSNLASGLTGTFTVDGATSALYLNVVPEPSSLALLGIGLGAMLAVRVRSRKV